jgi:hypothetical protein
MCQDPRRLAAPGVSHSHLWLANTPAVARTLDYVPNFSYFSGQDPFIDLSDRILKQAPDKLHVETSNSMSAVPEYYFQVAYQHVSGMPRGCGSTLISSLKIAQVPKIHSIRLSIVFLANVEHVVLN